MASKTWSQGGSAPGRDLPLFEEPLETTEKRPIAIIGAGFTGILAALHLRRRLPSAQPVLLCGRAEDGAREADDGAGGGQNLLNVRAPNMSALADEPNHFVEWLKRHDGTSLTGLQDTPAGLFVTRAVYARYLRALLDEAIDASAAEGGLHLLNDDVTDITEANRTGYALKCGREGRIDVAGVVLAQDNLAPEELDDPRICADPWGEKAARPLDNDRPVLIVGAGLAMVDVAIALRRRGFSGQIIAVSRRGLLPTRHAATGTWPTPHFTLAEERSLTQLMVRLRDEVFAAAEQGVDWRAVIDSMRGVTAQLWGRLPPVERRRFLRHARRYWDTHRHRMAPPTADLIEGMLKDGSLSVVAGRIHGFVSGWDRVTVRYTPRGASAENTLQVQRVLIASFLDQIDRTSDELMQRMLDRGLIRLDAQGLGLEVTEGLNVVRDDGTAAEHMWALGPIVRGVFWECVAVPDIRVQAGYAAVGVVARLREDAPKSGLLG
jgi:uncharacterized NAD(P)/FAD-binding protein YdhS